MLDLLCRAPSRRAAASSQRLGRLVFTLGIGLAAAADAGSITGVCPDGSVFVVRNPASIPCSHARRVEPHQVPPMRPENLPRSYLWDVYREKQNENNPYNLVDRADKVRGALAKGGSAPPPETMTPDDRGAPESEATLPQVASAPPVASAAPPPPAAPPKPELGLTDGELRDLFYLVELSQEQAPATFATEAGGQESLRVSFAHSQAFEARVRSATSVDGRTSRSCRDRPRSARSPAMRASSACWSAASANWTATTWCWAMPCCLPTSTSAARSISTGTTAASR